MTRFHNLADCSAYNVHLGSGEPVPTRKVAWGAGSADVAFDVGQSVVNAVEAAVLGGRSTIRARLFNHFKNFGARQIALVYSLIGLTQKHSAPFARSAVFQIAGLGHSTLFRRHVDPSFGATVPAFLSRPMTFLALVSEAKRAASVLQKYVGTRWQLLVAAVADAMPRQFCHSSNSSHTEGVIMFPISKQDGPHWQLPWKQYPKEN
jgi:hypothetical protein